MTDQPDAPDPGEAGGVRQPVVLRLARSGHDHRRLSLVDGEGNEFSLEVTPELRAALRDNRDRRSHQEMKMTNSIRPREIQTRIRSGESAESVATAAGTTVEAIMAYVGPVLAEREHMAGRALRASLRRTSGEGGPTQSRALGDAVESHLRSLGRAASEPAGTGDVAWDAYRRETSGRWVLTATFDLPGRTGEAQFVFDAPGNYVMTDNEDARWLVGDLPAAESIEPTRDDLQLARERRLAAVPVEEAPAAAATPAAGDLADLAASVAADPGDRPGSGQGSFSFFDDLPLGGDAEVETSPPASADEPLRATADQVPAPAPDAGEDADADRGRSKRPVQKKRGRASVPSWDEIMFGSSDQG